MHPTARPKAWIAMPAAAILAALAFAAPAAAQTATGCTAAPALAGAPTELSCGFGLAITIEAGAAFRLADPDADGMPRALVLERGAALVSVDPSAGRQFRVLTPRAIASVRGTEWAVDAGRVTTAVFVVAGRVNVVARDGGGGAVLQAGEGVDVSGPTAAPLTVRRWGAARAAALLARLER